MPRIPVRIQNGTFGTDNPSDFVQGYANRAIARPVLLARGPSQAVEQFSTPGIEPPVARALNQLQQNINSAVSVSKNSPFANGNLLEKYRLTSGSNRVKHGLDGPARGFVFLWSDVLVTSRISGISPATDSEIGIFVSATVTADIWVFK